MTVGGKKERFDVCEKCSGQDYLLSASEGRLHAVLCRCFHCEECNGFGRVFQEDKMGRSSVRTCTCMDFQKRLRMLSDSGIPAKFMNATFDSFQTSAKIRNGQKTTLKLLPWIF